MFIRNCQTNFWTTRNSPLSFITLDNWRKKRPKTFLHWKVCLSFKKLCFQQPLRSQRIDLITNIVKVKKPWVPLQTLLWSLCYSILRDKGNHNFFLTGKFACFFFKNCVFSNLSSPEEINFNFHSSCYNTLWTFKNCSRRFSQLIIRLKVSQKLLSPWEQLIFENFLAIDLLGSIEETLSIGKWLSSEPCGPSKNVSWPLLCSIFWENLGQNLFFTGKIAFFSKSCVFNNLLDPEETIWVFHQLLSD